MKYECTKYRYTMNVKLSHIISRTMVNSVFPNVEDFVLSSKNFDDLEQTLVSANSINTEIIASLNQASQEERFGMISEINPKHSNQPTISKEWADDEIAKLWIIDKIHQKEHPGPIKALGLAQVLEVQEHSDRRWNYDA